MGAASFDDEPDHDDQPAPGVASDSSDVGEAAASERRPRHPLEGLVTEVISAVASPDVSDLVVAAALGRAGLSRLPDTTEELATFVRAHLAPVVDDAVGPGTGPLLAESVDEVLRRASSLPPPEPRPLPDPPQGPFGESPPSHVRPRVTEREADEAVRARQGAPLDLPSIEGAGLDTGRRPDPEPSPEPTGPVPRRATPMLAASDDADPFAAFDPPRDRAREAASAAGPALDPPAPAAPSPAETDSDRPEPDGDPSTAGGIPAAPTSGLDLAMASADMAALSTSRRDPPGAALYALATWSTLSRLQTRARAVGRETARARSRVRTLAQHLARRLAARSATKGGLDPVSGEVRRVLEAARALAGRTEGRTGFGLLMLAGDAAVRPAPDAAGAATAEEGLEATAVRIDALRGLARNLTRLGAQAMRRDWLDVGQGCTSLAVALRRTADLEEDLAQLLYAPHTADRKAQLIGWAILGTGFLASLGLVAGIIFLLAR